MRVLTSIGLCDETGYQTYAANARTRFKIQQGSIGAEKHQYDNPRLFYGLNGLTILQFRSRFWHGIISCRNSPLALGNPY